MKEKKRFEVHLRQRIQRANDLFSMEKVGKEEYEKFIDDLEELWSKLEPLTEPFRLEVLSQGQKIYYLRTLLIGEKKEKEMAKIPIEATREGTGRELLQLTWLLIMESWDQLFAQRLEKEKGEIHLDWLVSYQEEEYRKLLEREGVADNG